jgi:hypothetical protein
VFSRNREFWYSLVAIAAITALYALAYRQAGTFPKASTLVGHGIGIVGIVLMLMTATLYSLRKRSHDARWGSMAGWLRLHMVTGLVGPYMVLLHTSMRFHGVAGVAMLFTVVVVISGLVGRYIYTAVPRVIEGAEPGLSALDRRIARSELSPMVAADAATGSAVALDASHPGSDQPAVVQAVSAGRPAPDQRIDRVAPGRGALATWHAIHVPLVAALFIVALVHMVGALYYVLG